MDAEPAEGTRLRREDAESVRSDYDGPARAVAQRKDRAVGEHLGMARAIEHTW